MPNWVLVLLFVITWILITFKDYIVSFLQDHLSLRRETHLIQYKDKIKLYQEIIRTLADLVNGLEVIASADAWGNVEARARFMHIVYPARIQVIASLSLFASDAAVEACINFMNYIFLCCRGDLLYSNDTLTDLGDIFLDEIRKDIGIRKARITFETDDFGKLEQLKTKIQQAAEYRVSRI